MRSSSVGNRTRLLVMFTLAVFLLSLGLLFPGLSIFIPILMGIGLGFLIRGARRAGRGLGARASRDKARVAPEKRFNDRCPSCRHRVARGEDRCPECGAHLAIDARTYFTALAKVDRDEGDRCRRCGGQVHLTRVMSQEPPAPGQIRCQDCGSLLPSQDSGVAAGSSEIAGQ